MASIDVAGRGPGRMKNHMRPPDDGAADETIKIMWQTSYAVRIDSPKTRLHQHFGYDFRACRIDRNRDQYSVDPIAQGESSDVCGRAVHFMSKRNSQRF